MNNSTYITPKAYWRTPLAVLLSGYAVMGILTLLGMDFPAIAPDHKLNLLHISIGRWLDPLFLALGSVIYVRYLDLTDDNRKERTAFLELFWSMAAFGALIGFAFYPTLYLEEIIAENWLAGDLAWYLRFVGGLLYGGLLFVFLLCDNGTIIKRLFLKQDGITNIDMECTNFNEFNLSDVVGPVLFGFSVGAGLAIGYALFLGTFFALIALLLVFKGTGWLVRSTYAWTAEKKPVRSILRWLSGQ